MEMVLCSAGVFFPGSRCVDAVWDDKVKGATVFRDKLKRATAAKISTELFPVGAR